jgi:hypothetical protein
LGRISSIGGPDDVVRNLSLHLLGGAVCELSDVELRELEEMLEAAAKAAAERTASKKRVPTALSEPFRLGPEEVPVESN